MTRRWNQVTGQEEEQQPDGSWAPATSRSPLEAATTVAPRAPQVNIPATPTSNGLQPRTPRAPNSGFQGPDPSEFGDRLTRAWGVPGPEAPDTTGVNIGAMVGQRGVAERPMVDLGNGLLPEDQQLIDTLTGLMSQIGEGATPPAAPTLPTPPEVQVNPGLQVMADHTARRQGQMEDLISSLAGDIERRRSRSENKWVLLGQWLSDWSATGDPSQAGAAMSRVLASNEDMRRDLERETIALTQMGWSAEDAVTQAQANLLAGQTAAAQATADRGYERDVRQADINARYETTGWQARSRVAESQADLAARIAEITHGAAGRARASRQEGLAALTEVPEYASQAWTGMVPEAITDPNQRASVAGVMASRQAEAGLFAYIVSNQGAGGRNTLQFLRQWDPSLTERDISQTPPQALFMRLLRAPNAQAAFSQNPDIGTWSRFAAPTE